MASKRILELELDVANYETELDDKHKFINELKDIIAQKKQCIQDLQLNLNRMTYTADDLRQQISEKDEHLRQLEVN